MSKLEKYICVTYICAAIVLGGIGGYYKFILSNMTSNSIEKKDNNKSNDKTEDNVNDNKEKVLSTNLETKKHGQVVNIESNLCIRKEPDLKSPADDYLYNGMTFDILEKDDSWYKINHNDAVGYVKEDYVDEYDEAPPNLTYDEIHRDKSIFEIPIPIKVELTAYCNCAICSEAWGSETAMQTHTRVGVVAAPKEIPLGSTVYIPELKDYKQDGVFKVEDRGGAVVVKSDGTYIIDVWLPTHEQVKEFGRKKMVVFLTKE